MFIVYAFLYCLCHFLFHRKGGLWSSEEPENVFENQLDFPNAHKIRLHSSLSVIIPEFDPDAFGFFSYVHTWSTAVDVD
jgi:hypothetical protein